MQKDRQSSNLALLLAAGVLLSANCAFARPTNTILFIGDGMGFGQVEAAHYFNGGDLSFETFPYRGTITTHSVGWEVTGSAAAGSALATGFKMEYGRVSMTSPDNRKPVTMLEFEKARGKRTGLVTTTYMTHATPAVFGAHQLSRSYYTAIANDYMTLTKPNVLFGADAHGMSASAAANAGYTVVTTLAQLLALDTKVVSMVSGQFPGDSPAGHIQWESALPWTATLPHLSEMTAVALRILENEPNGFFLMVEGGRIDHAGHEMNTSKLVPEMMEFDRAVQEAINWAEGRSDTLIIVTADHETGGATTVQDNGAGVLPTITWTGAGVHTGADVPVYAWGTNAHLVTNVVDNCDFYEIVTEDTPQDAAVYATAGTADQVDLSWEVGWDRTYYIERMTNLIAGNWELLETTTTVSSVMSFSDQDLTPNAAHFYRVRLQTHW